MRGVEGDSERAAQSPKGCLRFGGLALDLDSCTLTRESGETITLTRGEFALLRALAGRPGRVVSRETLLGVVSNRNLEPFDRSVDALICRLRRKIEPDQKAPRLIVTVPGEGYRFDGLAKAFQWATQPDDAPPSLDKGAGVTSPLEVGVPAQPKPAKPAEPVTSAAPSSQKRRFGLGPLAAALAALLVIAGGVWWFLNASRPTSVATKPPAEAARLSIVVMPFANLSGDPGQDYLVDALTDELTTALARFHNSFVIARDTAMTFKGKSMDARAIGKDLGVRYVLEGSVQSSGDRMRSTPNSSTPTATLTSGPNNSTRPAPIFCRHRTRSSRIWRTHSAFSSCRPTPHASNGRPRPIATPRTWLSNAPRARGRPE